MGAHTAIAPVVSKIFCSSSQAVLMVRRRPPTVNGGGLVVTDRNQTAAFRVDGCGTIGASGQLIVRDGDGSAILFIHKKVKVWSPATASSRLTDETLVSQGGVVQALSINNWWRGYLTDYGEPSKLVFSLQDPKPVLCTNTKGDVRVTVEPSGRKRHWDYEVTGSFAQRSCAIKNRAGQLVAQIGGKGMMAGRDLYQVVVQPGYDQAFVVGIIAILDNTHGESTSC
ncbi:Protein LURP-one-related 6 [Zea mays]|uniref:Protein LURP-one-related 6 n=1 Tax=Zea mays TaxID=4577 RepID=A0A3L6DFC7_MAIZE|nr:Protein LURP-one-related 6 [Zea mays]